MRVRSLAERVCRSFGLILSGGFTIRGAVSWCDTSRQAAWGHTASAIWCLPTIRHCLHILLMPVIPWSVPRLYEGTNVRQIDSLPLEGVTKIRDGTYFDVTETV